MAAVLPEHSPLPLHALIPAHFTSPPSWCSADAAPARPPVKIASAALAIRILLHLHVPAPLLGSPRVQGAPEGTASVEAVLTASACRARSSKFFATFPAISGWISQAGSEPPRSMKVS